MKDGEPFMALGTPGATRIFPSVFQAIINVIDHGMTLQQAVEAPRVWTQGQALEVEPGVAPQVRERLAALLRRERDLGTSASAVWGAGLREARRFRSAAPEDDATVMVIRVR